MDLDVFKVKILSGYEVPCHEVDPFGQCSIQDCMKCWNAKVAYERIEGEGRDDVSIFDKGIKEVIYHN